MTELLHSKCPVCKSFKTEAGLSSFTYATLGEKGLYQTLGRKCMNCTQVFRDVYRCEYIVTLKIISDDLKNELMGKGKGCPKCKSHELKPYEKGVCYDLEGRSGIHYRTQCKDCKHIFESEYVCQYVNNRPSVKSKDADGLIEGYPTCKTICPTCCHDDAKPHYNGLHLDTKQQLGVHITIECLRCGQIYQDVYKCIYIGTRKADIEYTDFHGRDLNEIEIYWCSNCYFSWTDEFGGQYGDFCPLCNAPEPYPVNQGC